ncbi:MAG: SIS domain-containing protein, partial [Candidatus Fonsibacter ubiquis]|nr:SIS domain-containing protein [Candidatus Fonsibacter ubiquis]
MCGIIGIASFKDISKEILESLKKLEYRGYDSAGISTISNGEIVENKCAGKVTDLEKLIKKTSLSGNIGIGHVRWATHGVPNQINAHPHSSDEVSVVHNGIIENSSIIKKELIEKGHIFKSQTDTEVITHLITENLKKMNYLDSVFETLKKLEGSFALGIIFKKFNEISEQPEVIKKCINEYLDKIRKEINIVNFPIDPKKISKVNLIACGTAYHACIVGKYWFEEFTNIDVNVDVASEFRYRNNKIKENELYIFVSQSGETADTIAALDFCKKEGAKTCAIVNVTESSLSRLSDLVLPIHVGAEIGVASTKAFTGQILVLLLFILKIAKIRNEIKADEYSN